MIIIPVCDRMHAVCVCTNENWQTKRFFRSYFHVLKLLKYFEIDMDASVCIELIAADGSDNGADQNVLKSDWCALAVSD